MSYKISYTQSNILYGSSAENIQEYLTSALEKISPRYTHIFGEEKPIGIDDAREIHRRAFLNPAGSQVFVLKKSDQMTPEAAQSMLKILEEPPLSSIFFLIAQSLVLLPTIISRSSVIYIRGEDESEESEEISSFFAEETKKLKKDLEIYIKNNGVASHDLLKKLNKCIFLSSQISTIRIPPKYLIDFMNITR